MARAIGVDGRIVEEADVDESDDSNVVSCRLRASQREAAVRDASAAFGPLRPRRGSMPVAGSGCENDEALIEADGPRGTAGTMAWVPVGARRCQIPAFIEFYHRIYKAAAIIASVTYGLSNGLTERVNTKLRR